MGRLDGKVALISGAGVGIGRATAHRFAAEGAKVVIAELDATTGAAAEAAIRTAGGDATFVATDVTDEGSVRDAVAATLAAYGRLDVLHCCAGGSVPEDGFVTDVDLEVWDRTISLDLEGAVLCCRVGIPAIIEAGGGSVVMMSSTAALQAWPSHIYSAAKGAIISLTRSMARTYGRKGVRVNAICPGYILTERVLSRMAEGEADALARRHPYGVGQPEEIANIALFLASDESRLLNGTAIAADGGMSSH